MFVTELSPAEAVGVAVLAGGVPPPTLVVHVEAGRGRALVLAWRGGGLVESTKWTVPRRSATADAEVSWTRY